MRERSASDLQRDLYALQARGLRLSAELKSCPSAFMRRGVEAKLQATRAEYARVHARWRAVCAQGRLFD